jgi:DNA ligase (NAD+)
VTEAEAANRLMRLAREIARHNRLYHDQDAPEISDADYDALVRENAELEAAFPHLVRADSPSAVVGAAPSTALAKVAHARPMLSLENGFSAEDVHEFVRRVRRFLSLSERSRSRSPPSRKIDGLSCSLRYEDGGLVLAATRGDGTSARTSPQTRARSATSRKVSKVSPAVLEISWRGLYDQGRLRRLERTSGRERGQGLSPIRAMALPARSARKTRRLPPPGPCASLPHGWGECSEPLGATQAEAVERLRTLGFPIDERFRLCADAGEALAHYAAIEHARADLPFTSTASSISSTDWTGRNAWASSAVPPAGARAQVSGRAGRDHPRGDRHPGRPHRQADARSGA